MHKRIIQFLLGGFFKRVTISLGIFVSFITIITVDDSPPEVPFVDVDLDTVSVANLLGY